MFYEIALGQVQSSSIGRFFRRGESVQISAHPLLSFPLSPFPPPHISFLSSPFSSFFGVASPPPLELRAGDATKKPVGFVGG